MKDSRKDDDFDRWLAGELRNRAETIEDDGFSRRVMTRLSTVPVTRRSSPLLWLGWALLAALLWLGWALLAALILLVWYPPLAGALLGVAGWAATLPTLDTAQLLYIGAGALTGVCGAVVALLWWDSARPV